MFFVNFLNTLLTSLLRLGAGLGGGAVAGVLKRRHGLPRRIRSSDLKLWMRKRLEEVRNIGTSPLSNLKGLHCELRFFVVWPLGNGQIKSLALNQKLWIETKTKRFLTGVLNLTSNIVCKHELKIIRFLGFFSIRVVFYFEQKLEFGWFGLGWFWLESYLQIVCSTNFLSPKGWLR